MLQSFLFRRLVIYIVYYLMSMISICLDLSQSGYDIATSGKESPVCREGRFGIIKDFGPTYRRQRRPTSGEISNGVFPLNLMSSCPSNGG